MISEWKEGHICSESVLQVECKWLIMIEQEDLVPGQKNLTLLRMVVVSMLIQGQQQDHEEPLGLSDLFSKI